MKNLDKDIEKVLIDAVKIQERICEMGAQITKDYEGRELVLVGVLKGAMPFLCDLMRPLIFRLLSIQWLFPAMGMIRFLREVSI